MWPGAATTSSEPTRSPGAIVRVGFVALYSKTDGIVNWRACVDPAADELVPVHTSHCGMSVNAQAFHAVAGALHRFRSLRPDDPLLADDLPRAA